MAMHLPLSAETWDEWTPISAAQGQPHNGYIILVDSRAPVYASRRGNVAKRSLCFQIVRKRNENQEWLSLGGQGKSKCRRCIGIVPTAIRGVRPLQMLLVAEAFVCSFVMLMWKLYWTRTGLCGISRGRWGTEASLLLRSSYPFQASSKTSVKRSR